MSNVYDQQWVVFSSRYFVVVSGFSKHVHLVSWYKTAGIFTCTGTHFFSFWKIGRWWQVIFEMHTQNREFLLTFKLKEHLADLGIQIPSVGCASHRGSPWPLFFSPVGFRSTIIFRLGFIIESCKKIHQHLKKWWQRLPVCIKPYIFTRDHSSFSSRGGVGINKFSTPSTCMSQKKLGYKWVINPIYIYIYPPFYK